MKGFEYINKPYVPKTDLETLGKTYDTLEQGHKDAVKAASDLENNFNMLDFNEAEDEWRYKKLNEIKKVISDNTVYGNSYAALDDIIAKSSDLTAPDVTGRLKAQAAYNKFNEDVQNSDMPQNYKDYYKEINPYHYEDKIDDKGNIIGGTVWSPNKTPQNVIPMSELISKGMSWASQESGKGQITRFIDENNNITTDPSKAVDGEVFDTITNEWQRLSKEKLIQGIKAAINTTPGALESINQDYEIANWEYNKAKKNAKAGEIIISDVTDKNGNLLSKSEYINNKIKDAVNAKSFYNNYSTHNFGQGYANYKKAMMKQKTIEDSLTSEGAMNPNLATANTPITIEYNKIGGLANERNILENALQEQINKYIRNKNGQRVHIDNFDIRKVDGNSLNAMRNRITQTIKNNGGDYAEIAKADAEFRKLSSDLLKNKKEYNYYTNKVEDKNTLDFITRANNNGELIAGASEYDDKLIDLRNKAFGNDVENLRVVFKNKDDYNYVLGNLNAGTNNGYKALGFISDIDENGNNYIELNRDNRDNFILFAKILNDSNNQLNAGNFSRTIKYLDKNNNDLSKDDIYNFNTTPKHRFNSSQIANIYNKANVSVEKDLKKVVESELTFENLNWSGRTIYEQQLNYLSDIGVISDAEHKDKESRVNRYIDQTIAGIDLTQYPVFSVNTENNKRTLTKNINNIDKQILTNEILAAYADKRLKHSITDHPIYGVGTNLIILPKGADKDDENVERKTFFVPGLFKDEAAKLYENNPKVKIQHKLDIHNLTGGIIPVTIRNDTPNMGEQTLNPLGNKIFEYEIGNEKYRISEEGAVEINATMDEFINEKYSIDGYGGYDVLSDDSKQEINNELANKAVKIANACGYDETSNFAKALFIKMLNDFRN